MTADEVSHMSSERELVFVAGHKPIYGNKLRYYLQPFFLDRLKKYQEIYVKEHGFDFCKKYPKGDGKACAECMKIKAEKNLPQIECPTYPLYSDQVTRVLTYENLFAVHEADKKSTAEKAEAVRQEKILCGNFEAEVKNQSKVSLEKNLSEKMTAESNAEIIACLEDYVVDVDAAAEVEIEIARQIAEKEIALEKAQKVLGSLEKVDEQKSQFGRVSADKLSNVEMGEGFNNIASLIKQAMQVGEELVKEKIKAAENTPVNTEFLEDVTEGTEQNENKNIVEGENVDDEGKKSG